MSSWTELQQGQDVPIKAGYFYAATAMVKNNHDAATIQQMIKSKGLNLFDYKDPAQLTGLTPDDGYRFVAVQVLAPNDDGTIPWGVPGILSWADNSHLLHVWTAPQSPAKPPAPVSPPESSPWGWILLGFASAGGAAWWWLRHRRKTA